MSDKNMEDILEAKRLRYGKKLKKAISDTPEIIETETGLKCVTLQDYRELERERDEARAAIPAGEWVAYKDHQKVHDAASRLLVAINKQLPIGSFTLILPEYYVLKDAIYGKKTND